MRSATARRSPRLELRDCLYLVPLPSLTIVDAPPTAPRCRRGAFPRCMSTRPRTWSQCRGRSSSRPSRRIGTPRSAWGGRRTRRATAADWSPENDSGGETRLTNTRAGWNPVPTAAPVGFPTSHFPSLAIAVNRRLPGALPLWLEGWRKQRSRKLLSGDLKVSEAWGWGDSTIKL